METFGQKSDLMCFELKKVAPKVKCRCFFRGHFLQFFSGKFGENWEKNHSHPKILPGPTPVLVGVFVITALSSTNIRRKVTTQYMVSPFTSP